MAAFLFKNYTILRFNHKTPTSKGSMNPAPPQMGMPVGRGVGVGTNVGIDGGIVGTGVGEETISIVGTGVGVSVTNSNGD